MSTAGRWRAGVDRQGGLPGLSPHFVGDRTAILVATCKMWKMTGPQVCARYDLTSEELAAAVKRIRRYAERLRRARSEV